MENYTNKFYETHIELVDFIDDRQIVRYEELLDYPNVLSLKVNACFPFNFCGLLCSSSLLQQAALDSNMQLLTEFLLQCTTLRLITFACLV